VGPLGQRGASARCAGRWDRRVGATTRWRGEVFAGPRAWAGRARERGLERVGPRGLAGPSGMRGELGPRKGVGWAEKETGWAGVWQLGPCWFSIYLGFFSLFYF